MQRVRAATDLAILHVLLVCSTRRVNRYGVYLEAKRAEERGFDFHGSFSGNTSQEFH